MNVKIIYSKSFEKALKKIFRSEPKRKQKIIERINLFRLNPTNPLLRDHALAGKMVHLRSFSIAGDLRIIYRIEGENIIFEMIGTHNQVYS